MENWKFLTYFLILLFGFRFVSKITEWIVVRFFKKRFPPDDKIISELLELKNDKKKYKKVREYAGWNVVLMLIIWWALIFCSFAVANSNANFLKEYLGNHLLPPWLVISILLLFLITSMGPASFISSAIILAVLKLKNQDIKASWLWIYYPGALKPGSSVNVLKYHKKGVNFVGINVYTRKILTILFFALILLLLGFVYFN